LLHVAGGSAALFFGPFQLWSGLRQRHLSIHRWTGRLYLGGVFVGGAAAFFLSFYTQPRDFGVALFVQATAWWLSVGMGFLAIKRYRIEVHKAWMIRGYVVTSRLSPFACGLTCPCCRIWVRPVCLRLPGSLGFCHCSLQRHSCDGGIPPAQSSPPPLPRRSWGSSVSELEARRPRGRLIGSSHSLPAKSWPVRIASSAFWGVAEWGGVPSGRSPRGPSGRIEIRIDVGTALYGLRATTTRAMRVAPRPPHSLVAPCSS
jgi:Predicted membrane protein (DUF2306)